jgi:hypothetical protein
MMLVAASKEREECKRQLGDLEAQLSAALESSGVGGALA